MSTVDSERLKAALLAELVDRVENGETVGVDQVDEDGNVIATATKAPVSAATMNVARQFLKDFPPETKAAGAKGEAKGELAAFVRKGVLSAATGTA